MSIYSNSVGIHNVGSYQVSGIPFVFSASNNTKTATLKFVTSEVQINTTATGCTVHFGDADSTVYSLPAGLSTFRVKCKKIVVVAPVGKTASVCASLTSIPARHLEQHTQGDWGSIATT